MARDRALQEKAVRALNLRRLREEQFDVLILGGGINGAGIARDLALRSSRAGVPLRVGLIEQRHFASGTSGKNSQLIHGGLRYLKNLEFGLVRESLRERATLLEIAPQLVEPLPFLIPMYGWLPLAFYGAGLWIYELLAAKRHLSRPRFLSSAAVARMEPGLDRHGLRAGAIFHDCRIHSARFVLENIFDAAECGAVVANYTRAATVRPGEVEVEDTLSGGRFSVRARKIVDARGPWEPTSELRLVRGSHIVLPRLNAADFAIAYFDEAGRIIFVIPWEGGFSLVGTTDVDHTTGPEDVRITREEVQYLLGTARRLFPQSAAAEPVAAYSSLRPLLRSDTESASETSREHRIWNAPDGVLHVAGGKYTTYRAMSEEAAEMVVREVAPSLAGKCFTAQTRLGTRTADLPMPEQIAHAVRHEMAQRLADVLFVSTYRGYHQRWSAEALRPMAGQMGALLGWDEARIAEEIALVLRITTFPAG